MTRRSRCFKFALATTAVVFVAAASNVVAGERIVAIGDSFQFVSASAQSRAQSLVRTMPASSTSNVAPDGSRKCSAGPRFGSVCSNKNLVTLSAVQPVSSASTCAATLDGARPNTARCSEPSESTAALRAVVLPVPAGPTMGAN